MLSRNFSFLAILSLTACAVGPDYHAPAPDVGEAWNALSVKDDKAVTQEKDAAAKYAGAWWQSFADKTLVQLMEQAVANNQELKIADARIAEARSNEDFAFSQLLPEVNATGSATREKQSASSGGNLDNVRQTGLSGTFEVDLFGENRRRKEAAAAALQAAMAERDRTQLNLLSDVARAYVRLRTAQKQREIIERNLTLQRGTLDVTKGQREEGAISDFEVVRAQAQVNATTARLPQIDTQITAAFNRLSVLTGEKPGKLNDLLKTPQPIPHADKAVVISTPIETVATRPDMRIAERRLAESAALSNAAFAQFFPKLTLEGFFGRQHSDLYGSISPWSASLNALFPLLNFGRISAQVNAADARQQQALYTYQQTLLLALEETENALTAYLNEQNRAQVLRATSADQARAAEIAREQYKAGVATQLDLLTAENSLLDAENEVALSEAATADNLVLLYRALGMPWVNPSSSRAEGQ